MRQWWWSADVTRWLRLAFLSPTLVRQIRAGAQPTSLTIETLTRQVDLPTNWQEQEALVAALDQRVDGEMALRDFRPFGPILL